MNKKRTSFCIHPDAIEKLKILAEKENRSQANMLEVLIIKAAELAGVPIE
jgi:hypothetical protein